MVVVVVVVGRRRRREEEEEGGSRRRRREEKKKKKNKNKKNKNKNENGTYNDTPYILKQTTALGAYSEQIQQYSNGINSSQHSGEANWLPDVFLQCS